MISLFSHLFHVQQHKLSASISLMIAIHMSACASTQKLSPGDTSEPTCPAGAKLKLKVDQSRPNPAKIKWIAMPPGKYTVKKKLPVKNMYAKPKIKRIKFKLKGFEVSKSEITVAQYRRCVEAKKCFYELEYPKCYDFKKKKWVLDSCPMVGLPMWRIIEFAKWAEARPISKIEWEYTTTSGGCKQLYPWGNEPANCSYANIKQKQVFYNDEAKEWVTIKNKQCKAKADTRTAVCLYPKGNNAQGVCDLVGNVRERVGDVVVDSLKLPRDGSPFFKLQEPNFLKESSRIRWEQQFPKVKDLSYKYLIEQCPKCPLHLYTRDTRFFTKGSHALDQDARESVPSMDNIYYGSSKPREKNVDMLGFRLVRPLSKQKKNRKK